MIHIKDIPKFDCKDECSKCCGLVPFSDEERSATMATHPLVQWERFDAQSWVATSALRTFTCPFLSKNACSIYSIRPKICQLFGAVDEPRMICPEGCGPKQKLTDMQSRQILGQLS